MSGPYVRVGWKVRILVHGVNNEYFGNKTGDVISKQDDGFTVKLDIGGFARIVEARDTWELNTGEEAGQYEES